MRVKKKKLLSFILIMLSVGMLSIIGFDKSYEYHPTFIQIKILSKEMNKIDTMINGLNMVKRIQYKEQLKTYDSLHSVFENHFAPYMNDALAKKVDEEQMAEIEKEFDIYTQNYRKWKAELSKKQNK